MTGATFYPSLLYADADSAIEWLERTFGFKRQEVHSAEDGSGVAHAELAFGGAVVMVSSAREAGADIALELTDTDYDSRDFTARDPEGTLWSFGTYRPGT